MKKILYLLIIILTFFTFQGALKKYDDLLSRNFNHFSSGKTAYTLAISGNLSAGETEKFQEDFDELLQKYQMDAYQRLYEVSTNEYLLWTNTSDANYLKNVPLQVGELTPIKKGDYYASRDEKARHTIFNPIQNEGYKIYYLSDFTHPLKSIYTPYAFAIHTKNPTETFEAFTQEIQANYPMLSIFPSVGEDYFPQPKTEYRELLTALMTGLMVILALNSLIVQQRKKVQFMKLEGYSNFEIYLEFVLKPLWKLVLLIILTNSGLYLLKIHTSFKNALPFLNYLLIPNLILFIGLLLFSCLSFFSIVLVNVNETVKGKSTLEKQKIFNYLIKVGVICVTGLIVLEGVTQMKQVAHLLLTEKQYEKRIENLYSVYSVKPESLGKVGEFNPEKELQVKAELTQKNKYFEMTPLEPLPVAGDTLLFSLTNYDFVKQITPTIKLPTGKEGLILIPEKLASQKTDILAALLKNERAKSTLKQPLIATYSASNQLFLPPSDYLKYGENSNIVFVATEALGLNISNTSYFTFTGTTQEAQNYFDNLYEENGTESTVMLQAVKASYAQPKFYFMEKFKMLLPIWGLVISVIVINSLQLGLFDQEINKKRNALLLIEGREMRALYGKELELNILLVCVAGLLLFQVTELKIPEIIVLTLSYCFLDTVLFAGLAHRKARKFLEVLR